MKPRMFVLPLGAGTVEQNAANRLIVAQGMGAARPARKKRRSAGKKKAAPAKRKRASSRKAKRPARLVKGSAAAKRYMASIRRKRKR